MRNIGNGTALNVKVKDIQLNEPTEPSTEIASFSRPVPILLKGESISLQPELLIDGKIMPGSDARNWIIDIFKPIIEIAKPSEFFHPEITIEFENVDRQRYFVKEKFAHGELEIIDYGKAGENFP